jgi:hypothetical protein
MSLCNLPLGCPDAHSPVDDGAMNHRDRSIPIPSDLGPSSGKVKHGITRQTVDLDAELDGRAVIHVVDGLQDESTSQRFANLIRVACLCKPTSSVSLFVEMAAAMSIFRTARSALLDLPQGYHVRT